jgi:DNA processing protein
VHGDHCSPADGVGVGHRARDGGPVGPDPGSSALPPEAWATALASLEGMGPRRLRALLDRFGPEGAWGAVRAGGLQRVPALAEALGTRSAEVSSTWATQARQIDPAACWHAHVAAGVGVVVIGHPGYPDGFADELDPAPILFHQGDPDVVVGARVAIVGTRDCTRYGYEVAFDLGRDLTEAGISIVSGLALGVDGAAHAGALEAGSTPPVAVVGSGLDRLYPRRHAGLWRQVARRGVVWSEYPLGTPAQAWHFPARNRLIATLADVVVVVESHDTGGALLTAEQAAARGRPVMAVPGPVRSAASAGTNRLLAESPGTSMARDATDVLVALNLEPGSRRTARERRPTPGALDAGLLHDLGWQPATLDQLVLRSGLGIDQVSAGLVRLELDGWVAQRGGWYERKAKSGG